MPRSLLRLLIPVLLLALAAALLARGSGATAEAGDVPRIQLRTVLAETLTSPGVRDAACHLAPRSGAGVVTKNVNVPGGGPVEARLEASGGDWDLAIFDDTGRALAAAAGAGAQEVASGWALTAGTLRVQACRRSGDAERAKVVVEHGVVPEALADHARSQQLQVVSVSTPTRAHKDRLMRLGLDLTEHGGRESVGVVLHGDRDAERLRDAGFEYAVKIPDLVARDIADRQADERFARTTARAPIPSGRTTYRTIADYENELKKLASDNPTLVRLIELPNKTYEGRTVHGVEITRNVTAADGKPAFLNVGVHHAREWPSGEHAMEWAYELIKGYQARDPRTVKVVENSRNIIVPIVNPDGFNASRNAPTAPAGGRDEDAQDDIVYLASNPNEYRRKNCRFANDMAGGSCNQGGTGAVDAGVDPNRNYGALWGGPGAEGGDRLNQTYRGPGPFSEPETKNIQWLVSRNQVMTLITNHTTAGLVLRAPGIQSLGDSIDENRGYKALGDEMALHNGYFSQKSFELYDTTGTTEDWSYNVTGGFGFTFEIYCGEPNYRTGDCDDPAFHPRYATMVKEWDGTSPQADHKTDPGKSTANPFGMVKNFNGGGNREAYYIAAESAMNEQRHSVLEGSAPAGATLRLVKQFKTQTSPQPQPDGSLKSIEFDDKLETTYQVGPTGSFRWHVNPSTRPIVAKSSGRAPTGNPSPPQDLATQKPTLLNCTGVLVPQPPCFEDIPFDVPAGPGIDNAQAIIRLTWQTEATDLDVEVFRRTAAGAITGEPVAASQLRGTDFEQVIVAEPSGRYTLRVTNSAPTATPSEPYDARVTYAGPQPPRPGAVESYTMTCEFNGQVLQTTQVTIDRGEVKQPNLGVCTRDAQTVATPPSFTPPTGGGTSAGCPVVGFRSVSARRSGRGVSLAFNRTTERPVNVDVFQQSIGRRVIGERLVARYANRTRGFRWNGRANRRGRRVTDGYYFVRYRMDFGGGQVDVRRVTLRRSRGRFSARPAFYRADGCRIVRSFKLTRPVFGGRRNSALGVSYRLNRSASVTVVVRRGRRVVRRYRAVSRAAGQTFRLRFDAERRPRGDYRVTLTARSGSSSESSTLVSRRL